MTAWAVCQLNLAFAAVDSRMQGGSSMQELLKLWIGVGIDVRHMQALSKAC